MAAVGTETAALNQPMIDIQEALAELEALEAARPKVQPTPMLTPPTTTTPHPHPRPLGRPDLPRPPASPEADRR